MGKNAILPVLIVADIVNGVEDASLHLTAAQAPID